MKKDFLYRELIDKKGMKTTQLVVPADHREEVMRVGHEILFGGHLMAKKTTDRVEAEFHWPGLSADVKRYCASCDMCQRTSPRGKVGRLPLGQMPLIDVPFSRVAVDIVGPIDPPTERGNRYILTLVDYATRYPEAVALRNIDTIRVAEALVEIFTRVGVPSEMLTDQGAQFTSKLMREIARLLRPNVMGLLKDLMVH